jgi:hypothetical protein
MGEVIRKAAATDDVIADLRIALTNARAKGGRWKELAEEQLETASTLVDGVEAWETQTSDQLTPLLAEVDAKNDEADRLLGRISDEIWNEVGRPASAPALSVLFPGGVAYCAEGDVEGQPDRMELLAELFESNVHPRLPARALPCLGAPNGERFLPEAPHDERREGRAGGGGDLLAHRRLLRNILGMFPDTPQRARQLLHPRRAPARHAPEDHAA